jgi:hypothetical protein
MPATSAAYTLVIKKAGWSRGEIGVRRGDAGLRGGGGGSCSGGGGIWGRVPAPVDSVPIYSSCVGKGEFGRERRGEEA